MHFPINLFILILTYYYMIWDRVLTMDTQKEVPQQRNGELLLYGAWDYLQIHRVSSIFYYTTAGQKVLSRQ